jgi:hypothetical protein
MKWRFLVAGCILFLFGCEKKIELELNSETPRLVVEAGIENGQPPRVILTKSLGYFSSISQDLIQQAFVHGAEVYVSNGSHTHKLKEYTVTLAPGATGYFYSIDSSNPATAFVGEFNKQYSLRIVSEGIEYNSTTTIPDPTRKVDSIWWKPAPNNDDTTKVVVMVRATDPAGYGDYIRYFTKINKQQEYFPPMFSVFDDLFIDGTTYEVQIQPGINRNADRDSIEHDFFSRGDTVSFKISNIDKNTYDFWRTWETAYSSVGNPFSSPIKVSGNISNKALGYFGGYASQYRLLIIPK